MSESESEEEISDGEQYAQKLIQYVDAMLNKDEMLKDEDLSDEDQDLEKNEKLAKDFIINQHQDDKDKNFVNKIRRKYLCLNNADPLPHTDAFLNCPACFSPVCYDCQQHTEYKHQFRSMFSVNCIVDKSRTQSFPPEAADDGEGCDFNFIVCNYCHTDLGYVGKSECIYFNH
ncbi:MAG: hypothetical protein MHPSP_002196, partial [Paramarteilia canceri]